jgi:hypothetical protein
MRWLIAILIAIAAAALTTLFISEPLASSVVSRFAFDNPDQVADLHSLIFMGCNLAGLLVGWGLGWLVGGWFTSSASEA